MDGSEQEAILDRHSGTYEGSLNLDYMSLGHTCLDFDGWFSAQL